MEHQTKKSNLLISVIILCSILISWSMVFAWIKFAWWSLSDDVFKQKVKEWIEDYIKEQQWKQADAQKQQEQDSVAKAKNLKPISDADHIRWNKDAKIVLVEYSDFECPFCKRFHDTVKQVMENYDWKVAWVYRQFPLSFHWEIAQKEAEASECVAEIAWNDKFWEYADLVYATTKSNWWLEESQLYTMADQVWVNKDKLKECLSSWKYVAKVKKDIEEWWAAWVTWTPWNFVVNKDTWEIIPIIWAQPFENIKQVIDWMIK